MLFMNRNTTYISEKLSFIMPVIKRSLVQKNIVNSNKSSNLSSGFALCLILLLGLFVSVQAQTSKTFATSGTFTVPDGVTSIKVEAWGAGGGGGGISIYNEPGSGGGGGGYSANISSVNPGQVIPYTVGTGGAGATYYQFSGLANASVGNSSTILTLTASGGGAGRSNSGAVGAGGTASGGTINKTGDNGFIGVASTRVNEGNGGNGGNGANGAIGGVGSNGTTGGSGSVPGGGGGGGYDNNHITNGGAGGNGQVVVTYLPAITSVTSISVGSTTTLANVVTGGKWTSATPSVATIDPTSGVLTGVSAGTSLITYTALGLSVTTTVTVIAPCVYGSTESPTGLPIFTPIIDIPSYVQQVSTTFKSGQHFVMNVIKGLTYQVYTSSSPTSPLKMTVYEEGNSSGPVLASSISNTGNPGGNAKDVYLSFTSPLSGQVRVMISLKSSCSATTTIGLTVNVNVSGGSNMLDDPTVAGSDVWIGQVYDGISFNNYIGNYNVTSLSGKTDQFQEGFGTSGTTWPSYNSDDGNGFNVSSNGAVRAQVLDQTYSVHYRMNSTKSGFYTVSIASDDGTNLYVDNNPVYSRWDIHKPQVDGNQLISLSGSSSLLLDYYEQSGQNIVGFYNLTQIFSNALNINTSQAICKSSSGNAIGGDAIGTLTSGISLVGYQWYYSTSTAPTTRIKITTNGTGATFTPSASTFGNAAGIYYVYRVTTLKCTNNVGITNLTSMTNESNAATVRIKGCPNYWIGGAAPVSTTWNTSTDWNTASNWSDGVPYPGDNVEFAAPSPINTGNGGSDAKNNIVLDNDYSVGNFTNKSGKQLIIAPNTCLTVTGSITTTAGNNNQIYIQSSRTLPNGSLVFPQSSTAYATVEMYSMAEALDKTTPSKFQWQYFGVPVEQNITSPITASPTFDRSYVRSWDETQPQATHWKQLGNTDIMKPFYGYEITQVNPTTIIFQGKLINRNFTATSTDLTITNVTGSEIRFPGQHIFANPYTAAIDIKSFISGFGSDIDPSIYLYSTGSYADWGSPTGGALGKANGVNPGQYQAATQSTYLLGLPKQIPSMQAVLISVNIGGQGAASTVTFNYSDIVKNNELQRVKSKTDATSSSYVYTLIDVVGSQYSDRMWILSDTTYTRNYDRGYDAAKMFGIALAPQLYAQEKDGMYQIDAVDDMNNTVLGFQRGIDTEYTFNFTNVNTNTRYAGIYLVDTQENKIIDITASGTQYAFKAESVTTPVQRFIIVTRNLENESAGNGTQLKVFTSGNTVFVQNSGNLNGEMILYDMVGHSLKKAPFGPYGITAFQVGTIAGAYIVKASTSLEKVSEKIIIGK